MQKLFLAFIDGFLYPFFFVYYVFQFLRGRGSLDE